MGNKANTLLHERVAKLEILDKNQSTKINEIHKALMGNGQPGMIAEWNQWKGGVRLFGIIVSVVGAFLTIAVGVLAYIG